MDWQTNSLGTWSYNCDFHGNDIDYISDSSNHEECMKVYIYLKSVDNSLRITYNLDMPERNKLYSRYVDRCWISF